MGTETVNVKVDLVYPDEERVISILHQEIRAKAEELITKELRSEAMVELRRQLKDLVAEILSEGLVRTNSWGEPRENTTFKELAMQELTRKGHRDGPYREQGRTVAQIAMREMLDDELRGELGKEIAAAKKALKEAIDKELGGALVDVIRRAVT